LVFIEFLRRAKKCRAGALPQPAHPVQPGRGTGARV